MDMDKKLKSTVIMCLIIATLLAIVYIIGARSHSLEGTIIQTPLRSFNPDLLLEKNPIVIDDNIVNVDEFIQKCFKYLYVFSRPVVANTQASQSMINPYAHMLIHAKTKTSEPIQLAHPRNKKEVITIILQPYSVLIVPFAWRVSFTKNTKCKITGLHTLISLLPLPLP